MFSTSPLVNAPTTRSDTAPPPPSALDIEADGDITLHPDPDATLPRGADPEADLDPRRIAAIVAEADDLASEARTNTAVNPLAPVHRQAGQVGSHLDCQGTRTIALYGITASGHSFAAAAAAWLDRARMALAQ